MKPRRGAIARPAAVIIEDTGKHPESVMAALRAVFTNGGKRLLERVCADPKRPGFYDVDTRDFVFYLYVSPVNGHVVVLAARQKSGMRIVEAAAD